MQLTLEEFRPHYCPKLDLSQFKGRFDFASDEEAQLQLKELESEASKLKLLNALSKAMKAHENVVINNQSSQTFAEYITSVQKDIKKYNIDKIQREIKTIEHNLYYFHGLLNEDKASAEQEFPGRIKRAAEAASKLEQARERLFSPYVEIIDKIKSTSQQNKAHLKSLQKDLIIALNQQLKTALNAYLTPFKDGLFFRMKDCLILASHQDTVDASWHERMLNFFNTYQNYHTPNQSDVNEKNWQPLRNIMQKHMKNVEKINALTLEQIMGIISAPAEDLKTSPQPPKDEKKQASKTTTSPSRASFYLHIIHGVGDPEHIDGETDKYVIPLTPESTTIGQVRAHLFAAANKQYSPEKVSLHLIANGKRIDKDEKDNANFADVVQRKSGKSLDELEYTIYFGSKPLKQEKTPSLSHHFTSPDHRQLKPEEIKEPTELKIYGVIAEAQKNRADVKLNRACTIDSPYRMTICQVKAALFQQLYGEPIDSLTLIVNGTAVDAKSDRENFAAFVQKQTGESLADLANRYDIRFVLQKKQNQLTPQERKEPSDNENLAPHSAVKKTEEPIEKPRRNSEAPTSFWQTHPTLKKGVIVTGASTVAASVGTAIIAGISEALTGNPVSYFKATAGNSPVPILAEVVGGVVILAAICAAVYLKSRKNGSENIKAGSLTNSNM